MSDGQQRTLDEVADAVRLAVDGFRPLVNELYRQRTKIYLALEGCELTAGQHQEFVAKMQDLNVAIDQLRNALAVIAGWAIRVQVEATVDGG